MVVTWFSGGKPVPGQDADAGDPREERERPQQPQGSGQPAEELVPRKHPAFFGEKMHSRRIPLALRRLDLGEFDLIPGIKGMNETGNAKLARLVGTEA